MVVDMGLVDDLNKAGYYAGYIASSFMFGRIFSSYIWGRIADNIGRKKVLLVGCVSIATMSVLFGFSINFTMALLSRALLGLFNPIIGIAKTVISEICPTKHEASGMGIVTSAWNLGLVVGPAVGGLLARLTMQYPNIFGNSSLFKFFPYLLPNLATAFISIISGIFIYLYLPETLEDINTHETDKKYTKISDSNHMYETSLNHADDNDNMNNQEDESQPTEDVQGKMKVPQVQEEEVKEEAQDTESTCLIAFYLYYYR